MKHNQIRNTIDYLKRCRKARGNVHTFFFNQNFTLLDALKVAAEDINIQITEFLGKPVAEFIKERVRP